MRGLIRALKRAAPPNSSRTRLLWETERFAKSLPPGSMVLDAGCGDSPYRELFAHVRYESADFKQVPGATYDNAITHVCDLRAIPVEDSRYDFLLFHQVMEHLPDPCAVLAELHRVLKPGGKILYSAPLFYEPHQEPYDFYRYTSHGVEHLFKGAGFTIDWLDWLEGYYGTVAYQMSRMAQYLPARPASIATGVGGLLLAPWMVLLKAQMAACSLFFHWLETKSKFTAAGYPKNYIAIVAKPPVRLAFDFQATTNNDGG